MCSEKQILLICFSIGFIFIFIFYAMITLSLNRSVDKLFFLISQVRRVMRGESVGDATHADASSVLGVMCKAPSCQGVDCDVLMHVECMGSTCSCKAAH